jgi:FecR protein
MNSALKLMRSAVIAALLVFMAAMCAWTEQYSHVRIVRLSFAQGTVTIQRADSSEWAKAPVNTPIQEGFKISTGSDSFAEVEFENGSTARIGEASLLEFTRLALAGSGKKVNHLTLLQGYASFHVFPASADDYQLKVENTGLKPRGKAEFRADLEQRKLRVEVFRGAVDVSGPQAPRHSPRTTSWNWLQPLGRPMTSCVAFERTIGTGGWLGEKASSRRTIRRRVLIETHPPTVGVISTTMVRGLITRATAMVGLQTLQVCGLRSASGSGLGIQPSAIPGSAASRGLGCPIIMAIGSSTLIQDGSGYPAVSQTGGPRQR